MARNPKVPTSISLMSGTGHKKKAGSKGNLKKVLFVFSVEMFLLPSLFSNSASLDVYTVIKCVSDLSCPVVAMYFALCADGYHT